MRSRIVFFLFFLSLSVFSRAQNGPANGQPEPVLTTEITMPVFMTNPSPAFGATLGIVGNPGRQTIYYWISANYLVGSASLAGPFVETQARDNLSANNYVTVNPQLPASATSYDVLKTSTPISPTGACACAVATAVSPGAITNDQSNSTGAYTVNPANLTSLTMTLANEVQSAGVSHLILRQNGVLVSDLSVIGSGSLSGTGTANTYPIFTAAHTLGNSALTQTSNAVVLNNAGALDSFQVSNGYLRAILSATDANGFCTTNPCYGQSIQLGYSGAGFANGILGSQVLVGEQSSGTTAFTQGLSVQASVNGGTSTSLIGAFIGSTAGNGANAGAVTNQYGLQLQSAYNGSGSSSFTVATNKVLDIGWFPTAVGSGVTNDTGIYLEALGANPITGTHAAIYIADQGNQNYANANWSALHIASQSVGPGYTKATYALELDNAVGQVYLGSLNGCLYVTSNILTGTGSACGTGGGISWSSITAPSAQLSLSMAGYGSVFNYTSQVLPSFYWVNTEASTSSQNYNSPVLQLGATYWNAGGALSEMDQWYWSIVHGAGDNPTTTLAFVQSGSSGFAAVQVPNLTTPGTLTAGTSGTLANVLDWTVSSISLPSPATGHSGITVDTSTNGGAVGYYDNGTPHGFTALFGSKVQIGGQLGGTITSPTVIGLAFGSTLFSLSGTALTTSQCLGYVSAGTIGGVSCGAGGGDSITSPNSTLSVGGTSSATTLDINLAHANTYTATQTFPNGSISSAMIGTLSAGSNGLATGAFISSTAGGDLSGTLPSPTVVQIEGAAPPVSATVGGWNSSKQPIAANAHQVAAPFKCQDTSSSATAYACATVPALSTPLTGDIYSFYSINQNNSGSATLAIGGGTAYTIKKWQATANLAAGDLQAGASVLLRFDGTYFELDTPGNAPSGSGLSTATNCASSASPASCGSAQAGRVVIAAGATSVVVDTSAVTANSEIDIYEDSSLGAALSVTCNTNLINTMVTARTASTSFTITAGSSPVTNPACYTYLVVN
jgi:hypothetical protein